MKSESFRCKRTETTGVFAFAATLLLVVILSVSATAQDNPKSLDEQQAIEQQYDKLNIRHEAAMKTDSDEMFITMPGNWNDTDDFSIAKTAPTVKFAVVQGLEPEYLPLDDGANRSGAWGGWGDVTKGPDGNFYFSISNHLAYGAVSYVLSYNPETEEQKIALEAGEVIGWEPDDYGDGKIHGDMDFNPDGDTWFFTFWGPNPTQEEWDTVYKGSWVLHYNCFTGEAEDYGIPLEGGSWPYCNWDWERELLYGVDQNGQFIVYCTAGKKLLYGGYLPDGMKWSSRCILIDRPTGYVYSTDMNDDECHFIRYHRRNHRFEVMNAKVPINPVTGKRGMCRSHSEQADADGAYWCFDMFGTIFKFFPEEDRTEYVGINWGENGYYTANMAVSPDFEYIYYLPGDAFGSRHPEKRSPVVQYNIETGEKKVIAFLYDFYMEKYGYAPIRAYGLELDETGESLCFYVNGGFEEDTGTPDWGVPVRRPALFHITIPESER